MEDKLDSMMKFLVNFKTDVTKDFKTYKEDNDKNLKAMDKKLNDMKVNICDKLAETKAAINDNKKESNDIFDRMDKHMNLLEAEMKKKSSLIRTQSHTLMENLDRLNDQPAGRTTGSNQPSTNTAAKQALNNQPTGRTTINNQSCTDNTSTHESSWANEVESTIPSTNFTSSWATDVSKQLKIAADAIIDKPNPKYKNMEKLDTAVAQAAAKNPTVRKTKVDSVKGMKSIRKWFGNDTASEDSEVDTDTDIEEGTNDFEKVDRINKNKEKRKKVARNKKS